MAQTEKNNASNPENVQAQSELIEQKAIMNFLDELGNFFLTEKKEHIPREHIYYKHVSEAKIIDFHSPSGFIFSCRALCFIDSIDDAEFLTHKMYREDVRDQVVNEYLNEIVIPYIQNNGFFTYRITNTLVYGETIHQIMEVYYRYRQDEQPLYDPSLSVAIKELEKTNYERKGCRISLLTFNIKYDANIMENFNKLGWEDAAAIMANPRYRQYEEWLVVTAKARKLALSRILLTDQIYQEHSGMEYKILAEGIGENIRISWQRHSMKQKYANWNLLGFRKTGGFALDKFSVEDNGLLVIDAGSNGFIIEHLTQGETFYYTFLLKHSDEKKECIRFSLRIPTEKEAVLADRMLESFKAQSIPKSIRSAETVAILNKVEGEREQRECLKNYREAEAEKIRNRNLPKGEEEMELADLDDSIRTAVAQYNL